MFIVVRNWSLRSNFYCSLCRIQLTSCVKTRSTSGYMLDLWSPCCGFKTCLFVSRCSSSCKGRATVYHCQLSTPSLQSWLMSISESWVNSIPRNALAPRGLAAMACVWLKDNETEPSAAPLYGPLRLSVDLTLLCVCHILNLFWQTMLEMTLAVNCIRTPNNYHRRLAEALCIVSI